MVVPTADLIEQNIKQEVTIANGDTGEVSIAIPTDRQVFLKGYGYGHGDSSTFQLVCGTLTFPTRTDQEGSIAQPQIWGRPFYADRGSNIKLVITNNSGGSLTYEVMFIVLTSSFLDVKSTGGAILISTAAGSGTGNNSAIYNAAFTNAASVSTAFGLEVDPTPPAAVIAGTLATSTVAAVLAATQALRRGVLIQNPATNTINVLIGDASSQPIVLEAGREIFLEIDDLAEVYVKSASGTPTINFIGS